VSVAVATAHWKHLSEQYSSMSGPLRLSLGCLYIVYMH